MGSGCGSLIAENFPSSVTQLPILTALHARLPTLFAVIIHDCSGKVNTFLPIAAKFSCKTCRAVFLWVRNFRDISHFPASTIDIRSAKEERLCNAKS